jgi:ABC-2 type transport system permease protein
MMHMVWVIARKEWAEVFKNRFVLFTVAFLPLILTLLPLGILAATGPESDLGGITTEDMPASFAAACEGLAGAECGQYFLVSQFMLLFMIMPLAIPVTFAAYSVIGEKTTRTLEPVLATPISTLELLIGKAVAAAVPAIVATWGGFLIFVIGASFLSAGPGVLTKLTDPLWLMAIFLVGPLLAIAAVSVAVMISSRANDPRAAEQISMLVVLPLLAVFFGQIGGLFLINAELILWTALAMVLIDTALFAIAVNLFERENILTRWK